MCLTMISAVDGINENTCCDDNTRDATATGRKNNNEKHYYCREETRQEVEGIQAL